MVKKFHLWGFWKKWKSSFRPPHLFGIAESLLFFIQYDNFRIIQSIHIFLKLQLQKGVMGETSISTFLKSPSPQSEVIFSRLTVADLTNCFFFFCLKKRNVFFFFVITKNLIPIQISKILIFHKSSCFLFHLRSTCPIIILSVQFKKKKKKNGISFFSQIFSKWSKLKYWSKFENHFWSNLSPATWIL